MKIYFDTTCWIRTIENDLNQSSEKEKQTILRILEMVQKDPSKYEIVSCQTQINQLYTKKNSSNTDQKKKEALAYVIAQIEIYCSNTINNNPINSNSSRDELQRKISLRDNEDAKHIAIAWLREADYFITVDWSSILNINTDKQIEEALASMYHPTLCDTDKVVKICSPASFLECIKNSSS